MSSKKEWYAIHTYSGHEDKVKANLKQRIKATGMEDNIFQILIPTQDKVKVKNDKKKVVKDKIFPGYVLIEMIMDDDSWYVVRNTPGVIGFASAGTNPIPVQETEMAHVLQDMGLEETVTDIGVEEGQSVRVTEGPFEDFVGEVQEIDYEKNKLIVLVSMFGRETPVELEFDQIENV
ncbi:transcription termination/antitermination protein NusG [Natroniella acetigena]|uniref:transcription termination/antitermination protein NusG n=1 Tax=Natroniella acetigena TaxID=52004 RepID=UPI00200A95C5|nr:transcription termination/antitermination protein NusG [Natroniella acetigena]MCK8828592.1 transcription termination/antitermination protein NusG [Natroniella acetigena]